MKIIKRINVRVIIVVGLFISQMSNHVNAVELSSLYSDHMVIQRSKTITFTGTANAKERVTITLDDTTRSTATNNKGQWEVKLPARQAGGPFKIKIIGDNDTTIIKDVYIGDVWLASGQSNMDWKLKWEVNNWKKEVQNSDYPLIRLFDVQDNIQTTEQTSLTEGKWDVASSKTSAEFSAVAWFFAKHLQTNKNIPIGIIDSTWGGTPAESWTPLDALKTLAGYKTAAKSMQDNPEIWDKKIQQSFIEQKTKSDMLYRSTANEELGISDLNFDDSRWIKEQVDKKITYADITWLRKHFVLTQTPSQDTTVKIELGNYPSIVSIYLNGQKVGDKPSGQQPGAFEFSLNTLPKKILNKGKNVISIRAADSWDNKIRFGGNTSKMKMTLSSSKSTNTVDIAGTWLVNNTIEGKVPQPIRMYQKEGVLYNGMIHPLLNTALSGVIWYQGESNIKRSPEYAELFQTMITSWRTRWGQDDLPFIYAQLASMHAQQPKPMDSSWAKLREAQTQTLTLPNTAMVVLIDAGEAYDIHPRNKQIVGERMWHAANELVYGNKRESSGPLATSITQQENKLIVTYKHLGNGLTANAELKGFEVAGSNGKYHNAIARIKGDNVEVWSKQVKNPVSFRYGWADNSPANLYNNNGFPAIPLRLGE